MRKLMTTLLIAAAAMPAMASAQSQRELNRDRRDIRQEQRQLDNARARGDVRGIRENRQDLNRARREYREDFRDRNYRWGANDWSGYRNANPRLYARGNWRAPFRYTRFGVGARIAPSYFGRNYWIADPWAYRLPVAGYGRRWVRHYNDVILVDTRRGVVIRTIPGFWR